MRLVDLEPIWILKDNNKIGFLFICPINKNHYQTCFSIALSRKEQYDAVRKLLGNEIYDDFCFCIQFCDPECAWNVQGEFENLTVTPSLDGSKGGNWHGFITNGMIVGGL